MTSFQRQLEAIGSALILIGKLPEGAVWSLTCTNDDDADSPSVLNIYLKPGEEPSAVANTMHLGRFTDDRGDDFVSFRQGTLLISLVEQEEV